MRLPEGIVVDKEATFGKLKFSALRRENRERNEDGTVSTNIVSRTYDLRSSGQGMTIQITLPAEVPLKEFQYLEEVDLINPVVDTVASRTYSGADVGWYIKADDIVPKNGAAAPKPGTKPEQADGKPGDNGAKKG